MRIEMPFCRICYFVDAVAGCLRCRAHLEEFCSMCIIIHPSMRPVFDLGYDSPDDEDDDKRGRFSESSKLEPLASWSERLFQPPYPGATPQSLFHPGSTPAPSDGMLANARLVCRDGTPECLIYADGACIHNGRPLARAGWAFVFGEPSPSPSPSPPTANPHPFSGIVTGRLETNGPDGKPYPQTSNRAELRAVIAALQYRFWADGGFERLVIASDSEYVVKGVTEYMAKWESNGFRNSRGRPVANIDLWKLLVEELERSDEFGVRVLFWHVRRNLNTRADAAAGAAVNLGDEADFVEAFRLRLCRG